LKPVYTKKNMIDLQIKCLYLAQAFRKTDTFRLVLSLLFYIYTQNYRFSLDPTSIDTP
jgi:hypothetical protein